MPQLCHFERDLGEPNDSAKNCVELKSKKNIEEAGSRGVGNCAEKTLTRRDLGASNNLFEHK